MRNFVFGSTALTFDASLTLPTASVSLPADAQIVGIKCWGNPYVHALTIHFVGGAWDGEEERHFVLAKPGESLPLGAEMAGFVEGAVLPNTLAVFELDPPAPAKPVSIWYAPHYDATWPRLNYAKIDDAGMDLRAALSEDSLIIPAGENRLVPSGVHVAIPRAWQVEIRPRSGLANKHQISVTNAPGTIDAKYTGELLVSVENRSRVPYTLERGERFAQAVFMPYCRASLTAVESQDALGRTERGASGFGDSGRH